MRHGVVMLAGVLALAAGPVRAATGKVMLVLDASGSMWGQIGGVAKIDIARDVVEGLLADWDPGLELGLASYGHRRKGDCDDIEVLVPVGAGTLDAGTLDRIRSAMKGLVPKGKTPLSEAVRRSAEALKYTEDAATVILVSDGRETCDADPCDLGRTLERSGVDFTAHVIGFDVKEEEQAELRCLAEGTGGMFTTARDAPSLTTALRKTVTEVEKKVVLAEPSPPPVPAQDQGLRLVARYAAEGKEYDGDINWQVLAPEKDLEGKREVVAQAYRGRSGVVFRELTPGDYVVSAVLSDAGYIAREFSVRMPDFGILVQEVVLDIGTVRFDARPADGAEAFTENLNWTVFHPKADLSGKREQLAHFHRQSSGGVYVLPAGSWHVRGLLSDFGYFDVDRDIEVAAGGEEAHDFVLESGKVRFDARLAKGSETFDGDLGWNIFEKKADLSGKRNKLHGFWRVRTGSIFVLPAGEWRVEGVLADHGHTSATRNIAVEPGSEEAHEFDFDAGGLEMVARLSEEGEPFDGDLGWNIFEGKADLAGNRKKVAGFWRVNSGTWTVLPAGEYFLRATLADHGHNQAQATVTITPGGKHRADLGFGAGRVDLELTRGGEVPETNVAFEIRPSNGETVGDPIVKGWRVKARTLQILPAGSYVVRGSLPDVRDVKGEATFEVMEDGRTSVRVELSP